jgi:hypothetical protein
MLVSGDTPMAHCVVWMALASFLLAAPIVEFSAETASSNWPY